MSEFREAVRSLVGDTLKGVAHTVQGYILGSSIDENTHTCTLRIPNAHGGIHPAEGNVPQYLEHRNIPYPRPPKGIIQSLLSIADKGDPICIVGFKGGNPNFPYIISVLDYFYPVQGKASESTEDRASKTGSKFNTAAPVRPATVPPKSKQVGVTQFGYPNLSWGTENPVVRRLFKQEDAVKPAAKSVDKIREETSLLNLGMNEGLRQALRPISTTVPTTSGQSAFSPLGNRSSTSLSQDELRLRLQSTVDGLGGR